MIIGVDPHKGSQAATAVDAATNTAVSSLRVDATLGGYRQLLRWARQFGERCWAVENARGLGCHLAQWLVAPDEVVFDASRAAMARVRELSRGGRRKRRRDRRCCGRECCSATGRRFGSCCRGHNSGVCPDAGERRANLAAQRVRSVNQFHALCGRPDSRWCTDGAPGQHSCDASPPEIRPKTPPEATRKALAWDAVQPGRGAGHPIPLRGNTHPHPLDPQPDIPNRPVESRMR